MPANLSLWHLTWDRTGTHFCPSFRESWFFFLRFMRRLMCYLILLNFTERGGVGEKRNWENNAWLSIWCLWSFLPWSKHKLHERVMFLLFLHLFLHPIFLALFLKAILDHKRVKGGFGRRMFETMLVLSSLFQVHKPWKITTFLVFSIPI